jgi:hypothetical protein
MPGEHQRLRMQSLRADRAARAIDLQLELRERGELRVQLLDMLGRLSAPALMHRADAGPCHLRLSTAGMNSGIFYVRVSCGNAVESGKVLIMR